MKISTGLFDHMVVQRSARNVSDAAFAGKCDTRGVVKARVTRDRGTVRGFNWIKVGLAGRGKFAGRIKGLLAGGPYAVDLRIDGATGRTAESLHVADLLVGDVWLLGGQSNMEGVGLLKDAEPPHKLVRAFYMDDRWAVAREPIHNLYAAKDEVHGVLRPSAGPPPVIVFGVGPGISFARRMHELTGAPQGVIACAHGGTSMAQWDPVLKRLRGKSLYGAMVRRFAINGGKVAGVVWYQGESDANEQDAPLYTARMRKLIRAMRRDLDSARLPVVAVQIGRVVAWAGAESQWNSIQDQQRRLAGEIDRFAVVPAIDLELEDTIHITGRDQRRLGRQLAEAMSAITRGPRAARPPIALREVRIEQDPLRGLGNVVIEYDNVSGELRAAGRPTGFAIGGAAAAPCVCRVDLDGDRAVLRTALPQFDLENQHVYYGRGCDPCCNVTDSAGRSLPAMGPCQTAACVTISSRHLASTRFPAIRKS